MAVTAQCCIAGGGPAGMMLGLLLARAGITVAVLEKHADFLRDFRGDTIHPSTLELMFELGLLEDFRKLPHQELRAIGGQIGHFSLPVADFSHLPTRCKFIAMMPQWDFLNLLTRQAARYPSFRLMMQAEVTGLVEASGQVVGVSATTPSGPLEVRAPSSSPPTAGTRWSGTRPASRSRSLERPWTSYGFVSPAGPTILRRVLGGSFPAGSSP